MIAAVVGVTRCPTLTSRGDAGSVHRRSKCVPGPDAENT